MTIIGQIIERVHERHEKFHCEVVPMFPPCELVKEPMIVGAFAWIGLKTKQRLMLDTSLISVDGKSDTPSSLARDYLRIKYERPRHVMSEQADKFGRGLKHTPDMPLFAIPTVFERGFYVDIHSTYWQLLGLAGWDVDYYPGRWLGAGEPPEDFPFQQATRNEKLSRHCLVSVAIPGDMKIAQPGEKTPSVLRSPNPLCNMQMYRLILDVLNSIADEAVAAGAVYVNTDGYIAPDYDSAAKIIGVVADWGLEPRIKYRGAGWVDGAGSYAVGSHRSKVRMCKPQAIKKISPPEHIRWLRKRMSWLASRTRRMSDESLGADQVLR